MEDWGLTGYPGPVRISNTGGWVVDTADPALSQGGVAVLLDDDLNTASLQFYRQTADGGTAPVQLLPARWQSVTNPLRASLSGPGSTPTAETPGVRFHLRQPSW